MYFSKDTHLVDPEDHSILKVKGELLGGTECGETLHTGHNLLNADHLHGVGHHQSINHGDVGTLCHTTEKEISHYSIKCSITIKNILHLKKQL